MEYFAKTSENFCAEHSLAVPRGSCSSSPIRDWVRHLSQAGVITPQREVERIVRHVLAVTDEGVPMPDLSQCASEDRKRIAALVSHRAKRVPLERILGCMMFEGVEIELNQGVFRPYDESSALVEHAVLLLEMLPGPLRILDVGTGTGCILLALLRALPQASGVGIDNNEACIRLAQKNAIRNNLQDRASFRSGAWYCEGSEPFDLVISNPPRVASADIPRLLPEMRNHDPHTALDGGSDGLDFYRLLAKDLANLVADRGYGLFQTGPRHVVRIQQLFMRRGFGNVAIKHNFTGRPCVVLVERGRTRFWARFWGLVWGR